ncbi:MAG: hypothetical protein HW412_2437 [Bacteroidetes bacterium]|nr:hypothetical protein [Bacteroidota bacterium]
MNFRLRDADRSLKLFITTFLIVLTIGYMIGLAFVDHMTSLNSTGIQQQFLGNEGLEDQQEFKYAKSANEMFIFMHNHILSLALVFFAVGGILYFTSVLSEKVKVFLLLEPLVAVVTTFAGIALVRYVSPSFSWLVLISGISLFACYVLMVLVIFKELWFVRK